MTNKFLLNLLGSNPDLTSRKGRVDSVSILSRQSDLLTYLGRIAAILVLVLTIGVGNAWGTTYTWTMASGDLGTNNSGATPCSPATSVSKGSPSAKSWSIDWTWVDDDNKYLGWDGTKGIQIGKKNYGTNTVVLSTSGISGTITSVTVNGSIAKDGAATIAVSVGSTGFTYSGNSTASLTTTATGYAFTGSASGSISITMTSSAEKAMYIKSIVVEYSSCTSLASINGSISWSGGTSATLTWDAMSNVDATTPYTVTYRTGSDAYGSSNVGSITTNGAGKKTCTITSLTAGTSYDFKISVKAADGYCDKDSVITSTAPKITVKSAPVALTGSDYAEGVSGGGTVKTFTVSGAGLTGALTFTAPTNFQVSTDNGSTWSTSGGSKTLAASGTLAETTIKARLVEGLSVGTYGGATTYITISGGGAAAVNSSISITGTVSSACSVPTIGNPTLTSITGTTITVSCPTISGGTNCDVDEYGFIWKAGSAPMMASYDGKKKTGENNQSTAYNDGLSIDVANNTGTTYYIKAYAHNSAGNNVSSTALQVTPRSVAFNMNGHGSQVATQYVNNGSKASEPSAPSASYYTFNGWKLSGSAYNFSIATVTSDITLDADWSVIPVTALTLNYSTLKKYVGESSVTLSVSSVTPNTANPAVTWSSSDETVASVTSAGVVSFKKAGTATITATSTVSGGVTATCSVEVRSISSPTMQDEDGTSISGSGLSATWTLGTRTLAASEGTSNYKFKRWAVTNATPASTTNLSTTLGDPTGNVTVVAEFYKPRTVTKGTGTGTSTFTVSPTGEVKYGSSVTVTCAATDGYKNPWTLTVTPSDGATYDETGSTGSITISNITKNITIDLEYTDRGCTDHGASSITTGTDHNNYQAPINNNWKYGVRQILYTKEDLSLTTGKKGTIKSISFKYNYSSAMTKKDNVKIYMANTTLSSLSNSAGNYVPFSEFTEVYSGSLNCSTGWNEFILTTPFVYYSNKNLVVLIDDNSGYYDGSSYDFYVHPASGKQLYKTSDDSHLDPASAATWTGGTPADYRPHTDFCLQEGDMSQYTVTWHVGESTSTTSNVYEGTTFSSLSGSQPAHADNALAACGSTKFIGWVSADGEWNEDGKTVDWYNSYKVADNYQITGNTDFYTMYAEGSGGGSTTKSYGWEASESDASSWTISGPSQSSNQHNTGSYSGYINTNNTYVTFNEKVNVTEFSFYFTRTSDNNNYNVYIETSANGSDWSAAETFAMSSFATSVNWKKCSKTWDGETAYYVRFHCSNTTAVRYVDDVSITYGSTSYSNYRTGCTVSCSRPTPATPASITKTGATISWTDPATSGTLDHYEYKVWADGDDEPVSGTTNGTNLSKALTGLYSGVTYHWKVRRVCDGEDASIWVAGSDFTTTEATLTFSVPTGATAVDPSTTATNLPEADAPTDCGNCWEFAGWTAITSYSDDDAPVDLMPSGTKAKVSGDKTLYAVYASGSTYKRVSEASELTPATYLVTFTSLGQVYALSSDVHSKYSTDAVAYNIQSTIEKIGDDFYSLEPKPAYTWTFAGTSSAGTLYNAVGNKYINMSTTTILQASSGNMAFAFSDADSTWTVKSTSYYLHGYVSTSYGTYPGFEATSGSNSVQLYKRVIDSYATSPDCSKYTVTWDINNGATTSTTNVTKCQGYLASLPSAPADNTLVSCIPSDGKFVGWSANKVMPATDTRPSDLFADKEDAPEITDDITFYAVFAHETAGGEAATNTTYTFTSKSWGDATSSWNSTTDGDELTSGRGIKVLGSESAVGVTKNNFKAVTKVVVTYCTNASTGAGSIAVSVGETSYGSNTISKPSSGGTTLKTFEYTHAATTGTVTINASATSNSIYIYSVQIFYTGATTTYEGYRTACCDDPQLTFGTIASPVTEYVIVREDLASASAGVEIDCNFESNNTSEDITWYSTHRDKNDYVGAYTWTSSQPTDRLEIDIDPTNKKIIAKETGSWQITIAQAMGSTNYCDETATVNIIVKTVDKFIDNVNGNFSGEAQRLEDTGNGIVLPTEATFTINDGCSDGVERRLLGWIKASDLATYASGGRVNTIDDLKTADASNKVIAPGTKVQATGVTWYAVWGVEK